MSRSAINMLTMTRAEWLEKRAQELQSNPSHSPPTSQSKEQVTTANKDETKSTADDNTPSIEPDLREVDYKTIEYLWIGLYQDSPVGQTRLKPTGYPEYLLKRHFIPKKERQSETQSQQPSQPVINTFSSEDDVQPDGRASIPRPRPRPRPRPSSSEQMIFCVDELIYVGKLWDVYKGKLVLCDGTAKHKVMIMKLMKPDCFPEEYPSDSDDSNSAEEGFHTSDAAITSAYQEDYIYRYYLTELYGGVVPDYYGMFTCFAETDEANDEEEKGGPPDPWLCAMLMEDVGRGNMFSENEADFWDEEDCLNIKQAYRTLHEVAEVGHGEIADNHIIVNREQNRVAILDFQGANTFSSTRQPKRTKTMVEWDEGCLEEVLYPWRNRPRES